MAGKRGSKNILLVYPRIPKNTYWSFSYSLPFVGKKSIMPPLALITVAPMLPKEYNLRLLDLNVEDLNEGDIKWADAIMISSMIIQKDSLEDIISMTIKVREESQKDIRIVAGGPYPTQYYDKIQGVDHFILGEAESGIWDEKRGVLESFLMDFERGEAKKAYARVSIRKKGQGKEIDQNEYENLTAFFGENADIELVSSRPDMSLSPIPRYDLLKIKEYASMAVQMSRGCPFNCEFCSEPALYGDRSRLKSPHKFVAELETIYGLGYRGDVFVVDDNFIGNIKEVKDVLKDTIIFQKEKGYPFSLFTEASMNLAGDDNLMGLMRDAGFNMVFVGFESPDREVLKSMNKPQNLHIDSIEAVRKIQSYGITVSGGFIVGNDNEPEDICDKIFNFCQEAGIPTAMVGLLNAMKGSRLYERLNKEGRLRRDTEGDNTHNFGLNFEPLPGKDEKEIIQNYKELLGGLYDKKGHNYFERCKVLMENLDPNPKSTRDIGLTELRALGMSLLMEPLFSSYSKSYRRFMIYSTINHRRLFSEAVAKAITGRHLIKITNTALKADNLHNYFSEKLEYFKNEIENAWKNGLAESEEWYNILIKEKESFLRKAKEKINRFPPDYRPKLMETYQNMVLSLNSLIKETGYAV